MSFHSLLLLFGTMFALAAVPGLSTLTVSARAVAFGFIHGVWTTLGILVVDILFLAMASNSLNFMTRQNHIFIFFINLCGGAYLIFQGVQFLRSTVIPLKQNQTAFHSAWHSFVVGFVVTLGDIKAVIFYFALLPAFFDMGQVTFNQILVIILTASLSIASAKLFYAYLVIKVGEFWKSSKYWSWANRMAGVVMTGLGAGMILRGF